MSASTIDIPNFLPNTAASSPAVVAASIPRSPEPGVATSISNTAALGSHAVVTVSDLSSRMPGAVTPILFGDMRDFGPDCSAAGEGQPAAVLGAQEQDSERVIYFIPNFLRGAPSARDGIKPEPSVPLKPTIDGAIA